MVYFSILLFITGAVFGSFFTVVGSRIPLKKSIIKPRSHCENCNHYLKWYELIPIISYLIQKGRCSVCKTKISLIYPLIEILCGTLFLISFLIFGISYEFLISLIISSLLIIIFVSDFQYLYILDSPIVIGSLLVLVIKYFNNGTRSVLMSILCGILMFLLMLMIKIIGDKLFKRESLGGGDIKLSIFMGIVLGARLTLVSFIVSSFTALPFALIYTKIKKDAEVPFGPFLMIGTMFCFIFGDCIIKILEFI